MSIPVVDPVMKRRTLLATLGTISTGAVAGCASGSGGSDGSTDSNETDDTATETPTETPSSTPDTTPTHEESSLVRQGDCDKSSARSATVAFGETVVDVDGCLTARDGCHYPALVDAGYEDDVFRVVVEEIDESDPDEVCTEAIEYRDYAVESSFESGTPTTVEVVHDTAQGRETVATAHHD